MFPAAPSIGAAASFAGIPKKSSHAHGVLYSPHMDQATKDAFTALTTSVETGFAAVAEDIAEIRKDTADIRRSVATKDDLAALSTQVTSIESDLKSIRRDLNELRKKVENVTEFRQETDHALERIVAIEKHIGISRRTAA